MRFAREVPEPGSGLGYGGKIISIVRRVFPLGKDVHWVDCDGVITSKFRRPGRWQLIVREAVPEERLDVVREKDADSEARAVPQYYTTFQTTDRGLDADWPHLNLLLDELD